MKSSGPLKCAIAGFLCTPVRLHTFGQISRIEVLESLVVNEDDGRVNNSADDHERMGRPNAFRTTDEM